MLPSDRVQSVQDPQAVVVVLHHPDLLFHPKRHRGQGAIVSAEGSVRVAEQLGAHDQGGSGRRSEESITCGITSS